jgi:hypothetical protein
MLGSRTVTGTLQDANGTPLANTVIYFTPLRAFGSGGIVVPVQPEPVITDGSANFTVDLKTPETGEIPYQCTIGQFSFNFDLSAGSPVTIDDLLNGTVSPPPPPPVPDTTPPTVPTGLTATAQSDTEILLTWEASTDPAEGTPSIPSGLLLDIDTPGTVLLGWSAATD